MNKINNRNRIILAIGLAALLSFNFISSGDNTNDLDQPGLKWHRSAVILEGQLDLALKFGKDITEYVNKYYPGFNVQVYREVVGEGGKLHWFVDYKSMEEFNEFDQKIAMDTAFNDLIATSEGVFELPVDLVLLTIY